MRQSAQQIDPSLSWKQEVNRRVAEHKGRKNAALGEPQASAAHSSGSRAAQTAARVAARYAKAPSYSEMLADEARAAVRAAEAASRAALDAQAAAESVLAGLEAASFDTQTWEPEFSSAMQPEPVWSPAPEPILMAAPAVHSLSLPALKQTRPSQSFEVRWDEDLPTREAAPALAHLSRHETGFSAAPDHPWDTVSSAGDRLQIDGFEVVEPAQPIHANLIEFPRELVATRKLRPRRAEGPYAASVEAQAQLSIFEVEPWAISTEPEATGAAVEAGSAAWSGPEWSGIELDEEPQFGLPAEEPQPAIAAKTESACAALPIELAPTNRRLLAATIDFSLIGAAFLSAALLAVANVKALPPLRQIELASALSLPLVGLFYMALFFVLAKATPGMKYASLELRTMNGERPTRAQRCVRVAALAVSVLPLGLGAFWALFDEQHLCWHDRLAATYPRKG